MKKAGGATPDSDEYRALVGIDSQDPEHRVVVSRQSTRLKEEAKMAHNHAGKQVLDYVSDIVVDKTADWFGIIQEQRRNASSGTARDIRKTTPLTAMDELADSLAEVAKSIKQQVVDAKMSAPAPAAPLSPPSASGAAASSQPVVRVE